MSRLVTRLLPALLSIVILVGLGGAQSSAQITTAFDVSFNFSYQLTAPGDYGPLRATFSGVSNGGNSYTVTSISGTLGSYNITLLPPGAFAGNDNNLTYPSGAGYFTLGGVSFVMNGTDLNFYYYNGQYAITPVNSLGEGGVYTGTVTVATAPGPIPGTGLLSLAGLSLAGFASRFRRCKTVVAQLIERVLLLIKQAGQGFGVIALKSAPLTSNDAGQDASVPFHDKAAVWCLTSGGGALGVLIFCAFLMDARRIVALAYDPGAPILESLANIDSFTLAQWAVVVVLTFARRVDFSAVRLRRWEQVFGFALALYALLVVEPVSHRFTLALCLAIAGRIVFHSKLRRLSICLLLIGIEPAVWGLIPSKFDELCVLADAQAAHLLLLMGGYPALVQGALVRLADASHAVRIAAACDTIRPLVPVVLAYNLCVLSSGARLHHRYFLGFASVVVLVISENWLRLSLMTLSYEDYRFWHGGHAASMIAMANALLPFSVAGLVSRSSGNRAGIPSRWPLCLSAASVRGRAAA